VLLRPSVSGLAFDETGFNDLCARLARGELDPEKNRLSRAPRPLADPPRDLRSLDPSQKETLERKGTAAIQAGRIGICVMNGGMATRFGGGAKGVVSALPGHPQASFLAVKLGDVARLAADVPVAIMNSFATQAASEEHLRAIAWAKIPSADRYVFLQSIMPRVLADGTPLPDVEGAEALADTTVYATPGHGDTLGSLRRSAVLGRLRDRGVEHILVSNVDNLGATLDPVVVGAHIDAAEGGAAVSVEVVRRAHGDTGGCVARLPDSETAAIIEGFRLPVGVDLSLFPHFNTNTLWFSMDALATHHELEWFAVRRRIPWANGDAREVLQFEQLIGQVTELVPTAYIEVDRERRFLPIKTREDLAANTTRLEQFARAAGIVP
jgi:UTP--glucose-1-phosphate uridylyltransferase